MAKKSAERWIFNLRAYCQYNLNTKAKAYLQRQKGCQSCILPPPAASPPSPGPHGLWCTAPWTSSSGASPEGLPLSIAHNAHTTQVATPHTPPCAPQYAVLMSSSIAQGNT